MKRYEPPCPRVAFGFAAMVMTAITIGALVVLPSKMEPDSRAFALMEAANSAATNPCAAAQLKCVDLAAMNDSALAPVQAPAANLKCREQS
jgi:hypothetical protein